MLENVYEGLSAQKCKGRSNQKIQKTNVAKQNTTYTKHQVHQTKTKYANLRISNLWSVTVNQIKKVQKTKCIYFWILLLGGPSSPTEMYMKA